MLTLKLIVARALKMLLLSICVVIAFADCANAEDQSKMLFPLFEIRIIKEGDPEATTSKCIGNPITPLCAIDTWYAGRIFKETDKLREIAYGERPPIQKLMTPPPYNPHHTCYQVIGYWAYQKEDRIYETRDFLKPGDVAFMTRWGVAKKTADEKPIAGQCNLNPITYPFQSFILRQGSYGWYIYGDSHMVDFIHDPEPYHLRQ